MAEVRGGAGEPADRAELRDQPQHRCRLFAPRQSGGAGSLAVAGVGRVGLEARLFPGQPKAVPLRLRPALDIDYAGDTVPIVDAKTGEVTQASIFVAVLGASSYTFAEASLNPPSRSVSDTCTQRKKESRMPSQGSNATTRERPVNWS